MKLVSVAPTHQNQAPCIRQAKVGMAYALSRSSSTEFAMSRRACEHVTGVTVRHEGKPSGFGRVRLDIGVIPQRQKSGEIPKALSAQGEFGFKPSQSQFQGNV